MVFQHEFLKDQKHLILGISKLNFMLQSHGQSNFDPLPYNSSVDSEAVDYNDIYGAPASPAKDRSTLLTHR